MQSHRHYLTFSIWTMLLVKDNSLTWKLFKSIAAGQLKAKDHV